MKTMALLLVLVLGAAAVGIADESEERRKAPAPTYESPVLSLLFLPVNVLIKMASVFAPAEPPKASRESSGSPPK
jgi:hypothetical protein